MARSPCIPQCVFAVLRYFRARLSQLYSGCLCHFARVRLFPYDTHPALDRRGDHHHEFGRVYIGTIASFHLIATHAHCPNSWPKRLLRDRLLILSQRTDHRPPMTTVKHGDYNGDPLLPTSCGKIGWRGRIARVATSLLRQEGNLPHNLDICAIDLVDQPAPTLVSSSGDPGFWSSGASGVVLPILNSSHVFNDQPNKLRSFVSTNLIATELIVDF